MQEPVAVVDVRGGAFADGVGLFGGFYGGSEDDLQIFQKGDAGIYVFEVVLEFLFPSDVVSAVYLRKSGQAGTDDVTLFLFFRHKGHIADKLRAGTDDGHFAAEKRDRKRQGIQAHRRWRQKARRA